MRFPAHPSTKRAAKLPDMVSFPHTFMRALALATLTTLSAGVATAQWQWIDGTGSRVFSDTPPPAEKKQDGVSRKTWGLIAGGAGITALGAGGYFGLRAMGKSADSDDHCRGTLCDARGVELNDQADSAAWLSNIFVGVGLVGVGAGTWLLLTDDDKPEENQEPAPPSAGTFVTPVARQGGAAILLTGSW